MSSTSKLIVVVIVLISIIYAGKSLKNTMQETLKANQVKTEMQTLLEENIIADDHIEAKITMMHIKNLAPNFNLVQLLGDSLYDRAMAL